MEKVVGVEEQIAKAMEELAVRSTDSRDTKVWDYLEELPAGLSRERLPKHVAVIIDGNRRWAKNQGLEPVFGYSKSSHGFAKLAELCCRWGIKVLTAFAFSTANCWFRPQIEVDFLMYAFETVLLRDMDVCMRNDVRVSIIGDTTKLPTGLQAAITKITEASKKNTRLHAILSINYGGREDILQAYQAISRKVKDNLINPEDIDGNIMNQELRTKITEFPYPDLLIITSGEHRISDFLMWQLAYSELHFENCMWPDFGEKEFVNALRSLQQRRRRYGGQDEVDNLAVKVHNQST